VLLFNSQYKIMNEEELDRLFARYLEGKCTPEEIQQVERLVDVYDNESTAWETLNEQERRGWLSALYTNIKESISSYEHLRIKHRRQFILYKLAIAATVLLVISAGIWFYSSNHKATAPKNVNPEAGMASIISPGRNKAILTLADGSRLSLTDSIDGKIADQGAIKISKEGGMLVYTNTDQLLPSAEMMNTISTPRGGQYQVKLPDGTRVWLNAASSLKYPTVFNGKERMVQLSGEGYFEVAKNKDKPFKVLVTSAKTAGKEQVVEVLGTHFNLNGYEDEPEIRTTLLEGSVRVSSSFTKKRLILSPGQESRFNNGNIAVENVNTAEAVAWKNGLFVFGNERIESIMRRVARWYDLEIRYEGKVTDEIFVGSVSRYENVSDILKPLQLTNMVHFRIEGRRIIVMP
jgi:transmembrane sensor